MIIFQKRNVSFEIKTVILAILKNKSRMKDGAFSVSEWCISMTPADTVQGTGFVYGLLHYW